MKNIKLWIAVVLLVILGLVIAKLTWPKASNSSIPNLQLKGSELVIITVGEKYKESGYTATDKIDGNLTKKVKISGTIDNNKTGTYELKYEIKNSSGIKAEAKRFVKVIDTPYYKDSYDNLDNTKRGWWSGNKKDHSRPAGGADINELKKYAAYFMGPNDKVLYLTFDEGGDETYVKEIVEVLNKNNVQATFFLCKNYMVKNADLIKEMVKDGHSIGNHTANHYSMPGLATRAKFDKYLAEIQNMEKAYKDITGQEMDKIYRDPRGEWSYRDLQIVKDLGYRSFFYSADYLDWNGEVSKEYALNELMKRYHNGAIYLLHPKNKGNYLALDSFIKEMKKLGYRFDLVKNIP